MSREEQIKHYLRLIRESREMIQKYEGWLRGLGYQGLT